MIGDTLSSQNTDTLSLLQQEQISPAKADSDSLQLADLHAVQEVDSGFEGTPISYSPRTDDAIALTLLACFFLSSIALARGKKFLSQQVKDFVLHRERTSIFDSSTAADVRYLLVLVLQTCVLSGRFFPSSLCTSDIGTRYFSVLCFTMEGIRSSIFPVAPKKILRLRYCTYF